MNLSIELVTVVMEMIANVGFPIFISLFLLHRMESKLDSVVKALEELTHVISKHVD